MANNLDNPTKLGSYEAELEKHTGVSVVREDATQLAVTECHTVQMTLKKIHEILLGN